MEEVIRFLLSGGIANAGERRFRLQGKNHKTI